MPIYEYKCSTCGKTFEKIQKFSDAPIEVHEDCGGHVEKLISRSALQFKGSGWYVTDYAKGSGAASDTKSESKSEGKSEAKSESSSDSKSNGKGESKSETKSETKSTTSESKPAAPAAKSD
jgi:putative FmdB family regulatory protein